MILLICRIFKKKKKDSSELIYQRNRLTDLENRLMGTYGYQGKGIDVRFRTDMYTLLSMSNLRPLQ